MAPTNFDRKWEKLAEEVLSGMREWRVQHPRATLRAMEIALDERLNRMRARMLEDMALASRVANLQEAVAEARPTCTHCGGPLASRGKRKRRIQTHGGEDLVLERSYGVCPQCGVGVFPPG